MGDSGATNAAALLELSRKAIRLADEDYQRRPSLETVMVLVAARNFARQLEHRLDQLALHGAGVVETPLPRLTPLVPLTPLTPPPSSAPTGKWLARTRRWFSQFF